MVFVMKHIINCIFYILTVTFLFTLVISMNSQPSSMFLVSQNTAYATSEQQQEDSSENSDSNSPDVNEDSGTTQENVDSEQSEESDGEQNNSNNSDSSDSASSDQSNACPDTNDFANVPTYMGEDGCLYPCISPDNNGQGNNPQSCPVELQSQSSSGFSINEERPIQSQPQTTQEPQPNTQTNPGQNKFVSPNIGSDTTSNIPTSEGTSTTTQRSFNPASQFKPGSGQTESNIPLLSNDFSKPFTPGAGNAQVEGIGLAYLTVYPNFTYTGPAEICVFTSHPYEVKANPYCIEPDLDGTFHALQAPGLVGIRVLGNADPVDTSNCEFHIYPKQSKSCILNSLDSPLDSPFIKSKSETGAQDRVRTPIE